VRDYAGLVFLLLTAADLVVLGYGMRFVDLIPFVIRQGGGVAVLVVGLFLVYAVPFVGVWIAAGISLLRGRRLERSTISGLCFALVLQVLLLNCMLPTPPGVRYLWDIYHRVQASIYVIAMLRGVLLLRLWMADRARQESRH
jgi:hypothetical protein